MKKIFTLLTVICFGSFAFGLYRRNKFIQKTKRIIEKEKDRSEALLLNILPEENANELKETVGESSRVLVIGGGILGLEAAGALRSLGAKVPIFSGCAI